MENYEIHHFNNIPVVVFESHNYALPIWGEASNKLHMSLHLVTFDYHADTHAPLARFVSQSNLFAEYGPNHPAIRQLLRGKKYKRDSFIFDDVLAITSNVNNDEHIQTAAWFGYIESYTVICHLDEDEARCYQEADRQNYNVATYYSKNAFQNLPMGEIEKLATQPFILDIDLDYFAYSSCFCAAFVERISVLIKKAKLITIAKEPEYCPEHEDWNGQLALTQLMALIQSCIG